MFLVPRTLYPRFIAKSDAFILYRRQRFLIALLMSGIAMVMGAIQFLIIPKMMTFYIDNKLMTIAQDVAWSSLRFHYLSFVLIVLVFIYIFIIGPKRFMQKMKRLEIKKIEVIKSETIIDTLEIALIGFMVLVTCVLLTNVLILAIPLFW